MRQSYHLRKNLLDLHYNTQLQYFTTMVIMLFTYAVGITIAFLTGQIEYGDTPQLRLAFFITIVVFGFAVFFLQHFRSKLRNTLTQIEKLKL